MGFSAPAKARGVYFRLVSETSIRAIREHLEKILASRQFAGSERMCRFLKLAVEHALTGEQAPLKEYQIGVEVFDKAPSFDPRADPIVRVEARRLRVKLKKYYETEGAGDVAVIEIPERGYVATFREKEVPGPEPPAAGEMVTTRPDSLFYQCGKFIRLNRTVTAAALLAAALVGGTVAGFWSARAAKVERLRAKHRVAEARSLTDTILFELHDAIANLPGSTQARELLVKRAQQYLDSVALELGRDDALQRERAIAYERIGDVLGLPKSANLGRTSEALESYGKALEIYKALASPATANVTRAIDLARVYGSICEVHQIVGEFRKSLDACMQAERILTAPVAANPADLQMRADLAVTHQNQASAYFSLGEWERSREERMRALREFQELHRRRPDDERFLSELATVYHRMALLEEQTQQFQTARDYALQAVELFEQVSARNPGDIRRRLGWTIAMQRLGSILISLGDLPAALRAFEQVLPIRVQLLALDTHDARLLVKVAYSHAAIGVVLLNMGKPLLAQEHFERQLKIASELVKLDPVRVEHRYSLSEAYENLGRVAAKAGQRDRARNYLREALNIYDELGARDAISAEYAWVPDRIRKEMTRGR
jgi:eukaryotic-like serine/threonine-protein kinase